MVGTSKILTVSYGTFSCTLEGFDESFETMKAIAEYFRDLAADDRYFGAEPPTPDAEMLARIAEREIARRVEARREGTGIVLRASQAPGALAGTAQAGPKTAATDTAAAETAEDSADAAAAATDTGTGADAGIADPTAPEDDAIILASEGDFVTPREEATGEPARADLSGAAGKADTRGAVEEDRAEPEIADEDGDADAGDDAVSAGIASDDDADVPFAYDDLPGRRPVAPQIEPSAAAAPAPGARPEPGEDGDSVAARLRRIRSVVARSGASYGGDFCEDEHAQDFIARTATELGASLTADDAAEPADMADGDVDADTSGDDIPDALTARLAEAADADDETEADEPTPPTGDTRAFGVGEPGVDDEDEDGYFGDDLSEDTLSQLLADAMPRDDWPAAAAAPAAPAEAGADTAARLRVLRMKRSEFEATVALARDTGADMGGRDAVPEPDGAPEAVTSGEGALSPEQEADLQRELAEVEAELTEEFGEDDPADDDRDGTTANIFDVDEETVAADAVPDDRPAEPGRGTHLHASGADSDAARIFEEAESKLDAPDVSRRRSAIQHLRAAVAASRAEVRAGRRLEPDTDEQQAAYRSDLAQSVRPRRPQPGGGARTERAQRPQDARPAPLKLVAEQRIDTQREPVRPRRVSPAQMAAAPHTAASRSDFADFAGELGAVELPDLLEAAAAYLADVEGREQFSRPMLMGKLKEATGEAFSREDGLRSFGHLLRQGKLQKLRGGRFTVTEQTEFRDSARRAAG